jgi:hypothetical protein
LGFEVQLKASFPQGREAFSKDEEAEAEAEKEYDYEDENSRNRRGIRSTDRLKICVTLLREESD